MSQIALIVERAGSKQVDLVQRLRAFTAGGIATIVAAIRDQEPVFVQPLFDRNNADLPLRLLILFEWFESEAVSYKAFELLPDERYDPGKSNEYFTLNATKLANLIACRKLSVEEQRQIGSLQDQEGP